MRTASRPAPPSDDELANAAKAVAEQASAEPVQAPARASGKGKGPTKAGAVAMQTSTGVLRLKQEPPGVETPAMVLGAFVGTLIGYVVAWSSVHGAPGFGSELLYVVGGAVIMGLVGRFVLASMLEVRLTNEGREAFAGPIAGLIGLGFLGFTMFAFIAGGTASQKATPEKQPALGAVGADGRALAEHLALLTPWTLKVKGDKYIALVKEKAEVRIPTGKLTESDVNEIQKATGMPAAELERYASDEPFQPNTRLPETFVVDRFVDQLGPVLGIQRDNVTKPTQGKIMLTRRKANGTDESIMIPERPVLASDLAGALPQGTKLWVGIALGLPPHGGSTDHDQFVQETLDKYTSTQ